MPNDLNVTLQFRIHGNIANLLHDIADHVEDGKVSVVLRDVVMMGLVRYIDDARRQVKDRAKFNAMLQRHANAIERAQDEVVMSFTRAMSAYARKDGE